MAVNQANFPMGVDTDGNGYAIPKVSIDGQQRASVNADAVSGSALHAQAGYIYNGATFDRMRGTGGALNIVQTGRNYQEIQLLNLAVLDTTLHTGTVQLINTLAGQSNIMIDNPSDQAVTVTVYVKNLLGRQFQVWTGSVANAGQKILTDADIPIIRTPLYQIFANAQYSVAPTTGTLVVTFGGVQA